MRLFSGSKAVRGQNFLSWSFSLAEKQAHFILTSQYTLLLQYEYVYLIIREIMSLVRDLMFQRSLEEHSVEVLVISFGWQEGASHWLQETGCQYHMLLDPDRKVRGQPSTRLISDAHFKPLYFLFNWLFTLLDAADVRSLRPGSVSKESVKLQEHAALCRVRHGQYGVPEGASINTRRHVSGSMTPTSVCADKGSEGWSRSQPLTISREENLNGTL